MARKAEPAEGQLVRVTAVCRVRLDDIEAAPGQQFDCTEAQAAELYALGAIEGGFETKAQG